MITKFVVFFGLSYLIATSIAIPLYTDEDPLNIVYIPQEYQLAEPEANVLVRHVRSPEGGHGRVKIEYEDTPRRGRQGSVEYDHNIYTGGNGRYTVDAYARGTRNFDANRNDASAGIQGSFRF